MEIQFDIEARFIDGDRLFPWKRFTIQGTEECIDFEPRPGRKGYIESYEIIAHGASAEAVVKKFYKGEVKDFERILRTATP